MTGRFSSFKLTRVDAVVLIFVCLFFTLIAQLALSRSRDQANRITCQNNLLVIGEAMQIYAKDHDGKYPRAGGPTSQWTKRIADFMAPNRYLAYQIASDGSGGYVTISSSLYLLVKYSGLLPDSFICPGDYGASVFNLADHGIFDKTPAELWDFGPYPGSQRNTNCSYAYHMPYGQYSLSTSSDPGMAVAADRNPWLSPSVKNSRYFSMFKPDGDRYAVKAGNTFTHEDEGQNVLFVDGHVSFETTSSCGVDNDNIYTSQDDMDIRIGILPAPYHTSPSTKTDSFLVNEPVMSIQTEIKQPQTINSSDLKQTSIVATLDCPIPEHRNVIWCSTFKMAWDKMKDDIIGEPIRVIGAEELAARLNQAKISPADLNEDSYYATAGFIEKSFIEQIQKDMAKLFPSEPVPSFNEFDGLSQEVKDEAILAYSYLNVNVEFEHLFYTNRKKFAFNNPDGTNTNVTSFCNFSELETEYENTKKISQQVDVLYYKRGKRHDGSEFAVDLSRQTQPYQVVLAVVPRRASLTEMIADLEKKISEFKLDPDYEELRKLRPKEHKDDMADELVVPDVLYILTHHFKELEGKSLGNRKYLGNIIYEAMQMIDFSLSRTGVVLKSESRMVSFGMEVHSVLPRYFHFNRPFLIYVKKRGAEHSPFFVMWVDNAELLNEFK
jgi:prepilin-type processing-associated H-X9-DG protein